VVVDGLIDRRALGRIVFADPEQLAALEAMTHPEIRRELATRIEEASGPVVVEIPIPVAWVPDDWPVVVVDAPDPVRVERLIGRGMDRDEVEARMAAQPSRDEWLALADRVIDNGGERSRLPDEVDGLIATLTGDPDA
jgi:dephospho-CoA kinase